MKNNEYKELAKIFGEERVRIDEPMSLHTTFKIGGPADYYIAVDTLENLVKAIQTAHRLNLPVTIIGGGSNMVVSDNGIQGLVIKNNCRKINVVDNVHIFAESGVIMNQLIRFAIDKGLGGLEYQLGLPGTVGGAVYMNSNFPKKDTFVGDCVERAKIITREGKVKEVGKEYFNFAYDFSELQNTKEIVLSVVFKLKPMDKDLLNQRANEALFHRTSSQPKGASAGCTFRNIGAHQAVKNENGQDVTSAGYLIDQAGLKGKRIGGAMVSPMHANFIQNVDHAKASDVLALADVIKKQVAEKFGIDLWLEVDVVGN